MLIHTSSLGTRRICHFICSDRYVWSPSHWDRFPPILDLIRPITAIYLQWGRFDILTVWYMMLLHSLFSTSDVFRNTLCTGSCNLGKFVARLIFSSCLKTAQAPAQLTCVAECYITRFVALVGCRSIHMHPEAFMSVYLFGPLANYNYCIFITQIFNEIVSLKRRKLTFKILWGNQMITV